MFADRLGSWPVILGPGLAGLLSQALLADRLQEAWTAGDLVAFTVLAVLGVAGAVMALAMAAAVLAWSYEECVRRWANAWELRRREEAARQNALVSAAWSRGMAERAQPPQLLPPPDPPAPPPLPPFPPRA